MLWQGTSSVHILFITITMLWQETSVHILFITITMLWQGTTIIVSECATTLLFFFKLCLALISAASLPQGTITSIPVDRTRAGITTALYLCNMALSHRYR